MDSPLSGQGRIESWQIGILEEGISSFEIDFAFCLLDAIIYNMISYIDIHTVHNNRILCCIVTPYTGDSRHAGDRRTEDNNNINGIWLRGCVPCVC